jgi:hypothetical protein
LPFIETLEDLELVREFGLHQAQGRPVTLKTLFVKGYGSVATVQRRIARLKRLGAVVQAKADYDKRLATLALSAAVWRSYDQLNRLMMKAR